MWNVNPPRTMILRHSSRMSVSAGQEAKLLPCRKLGVATPVSDPGYWVAPPPAHLLLLSIMPHMRIRISSQMRKLPLPNKIMSAIKVRGDERMMVSARYGGGMLREESHV